MYRADQAIGEEPVIKTQKTGARIIQLNIPVERDEEEDVLDAEPEEDDPNEE